MRGAAPGQFAHRVTVEVRAEAADGHGGWTETWASRWRRIPAKVKPLAGRDLERARAIDPRSSHEVRLPYWRAYAADLDAGRTRLVYHDLADRTLEIVSPPIDEEESHDVVILTCREAEAAA